MEVLAKQLFTNYELQTSSVTGFQCNKDYQARPGLSPSRRSLLESELIEKLLFYLLFLHIHRYTYMSILPNVTNIYFSLQSLSVISSWPTCTPFSPIQLRWKAPFVRIPCELVLLQFVNNIERVGARGRLKLDVRVPAIWQWLYTTDMLEKCWSNVVPWVLFERRVSEWVGEWLGKWVGEWVSEWVSNGDWTSTNPSVWWE